MANYIGFSTQFSNDKRILSMPNGSGGGTGTFSTPVQVGKKYKITDKNLVILDFLNALNIPQGQKVGKPEYGTTIWEFVFEPNTIETSSKIELEIRRIASLDPRLALNNINVKPYGNNILIEIEAAVLPFEDVDIIQILFDQLNNRATFA